MSGRTRWWAAGITIAVLALGARAGWPQRPVEEAILPLAEYKAQDGRALAQAHLGELQALYRSVRRCAPELDFHRHGLGFRRPLGSDTEPLHLATWVWIPSEPALPRDGIGARAAEAFRRYGATLLTQLAAREAIHADPRVGGYSLVLTWIKPQRADPPIGESLVVFLPKSAVTPFVGGQVTLTELLAQARIRAFEGQTEVSLGGLTVPDQAGSVRPPLC